MTQSGHFKNLTRTRCFACAIMCTGAVAGCGALTRPGCHPFGSVVFESGCAIVKYKIGRGTIMIGFAEGSA
jgi:hypothetical protein